MDSINFCITIYYSNHYWCQRYSWIYISQFYLMCASQFIILFSSEIRDHRGIVNLIWWTTNIARYCFGLSSYWHVIVVCTILCQWSKLRFSHHLLPPPPPPIKVPSKHEGGVNLIINLDRKGFLLMSKVLYFCHINSSLPRDFFCQQAKKI